MSSSVLDRARADPALRVEAVERTRWIELASRFADHNYRQTWDFGVHAAARVGAESEHVALGDGSSVVGLADVRIRKVPLLGGGIAYVNGGPLTRADGAFDVARYAAAVDVLRREYAVRRGLVLRVAAPVGPPSWNAGVAAALGSLGFTPSTSSPPYRTMLLDIGRPAGDVRRTLRQKWRNCLHKAERAGLRVRSSSDAAGASEFRAIFDEFVARKGVRSPLDAAWYARVQAELPESERLVVLLAEQDGRVVAGHLSSVLGDTMTYLLGATSPEALTCCAAYLLQWRAVEVAKERGCVWYDLGGVDPDANPGVHHFKEGLGGTDVTAAGPVHWHAGPRAQFVLAVESRVRGRRRARSGGDVR